jgi:ADP-heptose:LPS heptosyltransferase
MLETIRSGIGITIAQLRIRRTPESVISFTSSVSSARSALILMPLREQVLVPTTAVIELLKRKFPEENLTLITREHDLSLPPLLPRSTVIRLVKDDINYFYLPRTSFLERLAKRKYDLAIDLNLDLVLPSAYICRESKARVRVGFIRHRSDMFYNFAIQLNPGLNKEEMYERLANCLQMF